MAEISIIVPVYNTEEYLCQCVDSVLAQDFTDYELILIDDGSTDGGGALCDEYADRDGRIRVIHQTNQGLAETRNIGLAAAKGRYIAFLDSDDYWAPDMLSFMRKLCEENDADIAICGTWLHMRDGSIKQHRPGDKGGLMTPEEALVALNSFRGFNMSAHTKLYKREMFEGVVYPKGKKSEDYFTCYRIFSNAKRIIYAAEPKYYYRLRSGSISRGGVINLDAMEAAESQLEFFEERYPELVNVAETACFFSQISAYNAHINRRMRCPSELMKRLKKRSRECLPSVLENENISRVKKAQARLFAIYPPAYRLVYKLITRSGENR